MSFAKEIEKNTSFQIVVKFNLFDERYRFFLDRLQIVVNLVFRFAVAVVLLGLRSIFDNIDANMEILLLLYRVVPGSASLLKLFSLGA